MIKVNIEKNKTKIISLTISGHSNYDEKGKDIVCAGVSAIVVGGLNSLLIEEKTAIYIFSFIQYPKFFLYKIIFLLLSVMAFLFIEEMWIGILDTDIGNFATHSASIISFILFLSQ